MLNRVILMGRIAQDLQLKKTQGGLSVLSFSVAVERSFATPNGERQADFINCVAWRQTAEFISKYFSKGRLIALEGNLRTRTYDDKNGAKHFITEVYVDNVSFTGEPKKDAEQNNPAPSVDNSELDIGALADYELAISDGNVPF